MSENFKLQVSNQHYAFEKYMSVERWISIWHQVNSIIKLDVKNVLEIGGGGGLLKNIMKTYGVNVKVIDIDPALNPDYLLDVRDANFDKEQFDLCVAFQVLEHMEYKNFKSILREMKRVSKKGCIISLPDSERIWPITAHVPRIGRKTLKIKKPFHKREDAVFDGEHYWEINKKGYDLEKIMVDLNEIFSSVETWRVDENPYHRFFLIN